MAPLPAGQLVYGVFSREAWTPRMLERRGLVVEWFRRQLSAPAPVVGATEADLLLVLASVVYAASLADRDVRKNRVAVVVNAIIGRHWLRVLPHIPDARRVLDELLARAGPDLLRGEAWTAIDDAPAVAEAREPPAQPSPPWGDGSLLADCRVAGTLGQAASVQAEARRNRPKYP